MRNRRIKVLLVDDNTNTQIFLKKIIEEDQRFELVAIATNGKEAIRLVKQYTPDVVSMNINLPLLNGIDSTRIIMQENPIPIVLISESSKGLSEKMKEVGVVAVLQKPAMKPTGDLKASCSQYLNTLALMSEIKVVRRKVISNRMGVLQTNRIINRDTPKTEKRFQVLVIGASSGGPEVLKTILSNLPVNFPLPILVVQHVDHNFISGLCSWLNTSSNLPVKIAIDGESLQPGIVYFPSPNTHLVVKTKGVIGLLAGQFRSPLVPSIDLLFKSVTQYYGAQSIAVLLTGMGKDGAKEMKNLHDCGAFTIVQDQTSSMVYGMPGEAIRLGGVSEVLSPLDIASKLNLLVNNHK